MRFSSDIRIFAANAITVLATAAQVIGFWPNSPEILSFTDRMHYNDCQTPLLDTICHLRCSLDTVAMASASLAGDRRAWSMKQERRTPAYTKDWNDLAVARA